MPVPREAERLEGVPMVQEIAHMPPDPVEGVRDRDFEVGCSSDNAVVLIRASEDREFIAQDGEPGRKLLELLWRPLRIHVYPDPLRRDVGQERPYSPENRGGALTTQG